MSEPCTAPDVARQLDDCTFCPKMCRHACPVSTASGRETYIPQAKMALLGRLRRGNAPWTTEATDPLWACTGCRHCTEYCEHGNEPGLVLLAGRAAAQKQGVGHPALADYGERFANREARLGRKQIVAARIEHALGKLISDGEQLSRRIQQKTELHLVEHFSREFVETFDSSNERLRTFCRFLQRHDETAVVGDGHRGAVRHEIGALLTQSFEQRLTAIRQFEQSRRRQRCGCAIGEWQQ